MGKFVNRKTIFGKEKSELALFPLFKKRYQPKSYYEDEPQVPWYIVHRPLIFIGVGILLMAVVAIGITIYINNNTPVAKLSYSLTKDLDSGCDFHIEAAVNEEQKMVFDGSAKITGQEIELSYDADYDSYTYQGVTLSQEGMNYSGSCYNGEWYVKNVNPKVLDFMDFYADLRHGFFDIGSFLRFLGVNEKYSSVEFGSLLGKVFPRFATQNGITHMKVTETKDSTTYAYDLDMDAFLTLLENISASSFFKSSDYDKFYEKIELNRSTLRRAKVNFSFEITKKGYLDNIDMSLESNDKHYTLTVRFDNFGSPTHTVPEDFYEAADIKNPNATEAPSLAIGMTDAATAAPTQAPTQAPATSAPAEASASEESGETGQEDEENTSQEDNEE